MAKAGMSRAKIIIIGIVFVAAIAGAYLYFSIFGTAPKPSIQKPVLAGEIEEEHVTWIANELGAYNLHPSLSGDPPEMEIVSDDKTYTITTKDGKPKAVMGKAKNPDIRIIASEQALIALFNAQDMNEEVVRLYKAGDVKVEVLKGEAELALKGYKAIYDAVQGSG